MSALALVCLGAFIYLALWAAIYKLFMPETLRGEYTVVVVSMVLTFVLAFWGFL